MPLGGTEKTRFRKQWEPLPDADAEGWPEGNSPALKLIWVRYKEAGLLDWDNKRVAVICRQINCTPFELCAAAGLFEAREVRQFWKDEKWPAYLTIHFRRIEDQVHHLKFMEEPETGPGPEDIAMAKLIARGQDKTKDSEAAETIKVTTTKNPKHKNFATLDCVAADGCKVTTESIKQNGS